MKGGHVITENLSSKVPPPNNPERICEEIINGISRESDESDLQVIDNFLSFIEGSFYSILHIKEVKNIQLLRPLFLFRSVKTVKQNGEMKQVVVDTKGI